MQTQCIRKGQTEVGIVEYEGQQFSATGATVAGRNLTGYTRNIDRRIVLTTWCGQTMLDCRCEVVERFWSGAVALMFRLPRGRFIVGYALSDHGMLFRGDLLEDCDEDEACSTARQLSDHFAELDAEEEDQLPQSC